MDACSDLNEESFRTGGSRLSITLFESVFSASVEESLRSGKIDIKKISPAYIERLKSDAAFIGYSTGKTTRGEFVRGRIKRAKEILKEF